MHIKKYLRNLCSEHHLPLKKKLSLLTHSFQRILEHSVQSKQHKQTIINNNTTNKIKQSQQETWTTTKQ